MRFVHFHFLTGITYLTFPINFYRMIKNWLQEATFSSKFTENLTEDAFGENLVDHHWRQRELRKVSIAIIGLDAAFAQKTREALYNFSWDFAGLPLADLGDVRKNHPDFIIPLLRELQASKIVPILIGGHANGFRAQYQAFQELKKQISILAVDQQMRFTTENNRIKANVLNPAVHGKRRKIYHLSHLGSQRHLVNPALYQLLDSRHFDYLRLGDARKNLQELEPLIRDADLVGVNFSAIKKLEAPAQNGNQPSGFDLVELTQICRYAGMSDKLGSFGIFGLDQSATDQDLDITASAAAQLIWYFVDGFANRKGDFPVSAKGLVEYIVDLKGYDRIVFWKSPRSGRWWIQSPAGQQNGEERHRLIPCSYSDYLKAVNQEIPDRLIAAFKRYE